MWPDVRNFDLVGVAEELRALSCQAEPPFSLPPIVAARWPDASITGRDLPSGVEEIVAFTSDGPLIVYRRDLSTAERRFAIAHALAHLLFDDGSTGVQAGHPFDSEQEVRADDFALELLAPWRCLRRHILLLPSEDRCDQESYLDQVDQIAAIYHVPPSAIDQRIRTLARQQNRMAISA